MTQSIYTLRILAMCYCGFFTYRMSINAFPDMKYTNLIAHKDKASYL